MLNSPFNNQLLVLVLLGGSNNLLEPYNLLLNTHLRSKLTCYLKLLVNPQEGYMQITNLRASLLLTILLGCFITTSAFGQSAFENSYFQALYPTESSLVWDQDINADNNLYNPGSEVPALAPTTSTLGSSTVFMANARHSHKKTTSLTIGTIVEEYALQSANGDYRFGFEGGATGLMLSSKSSSLMLSYGVADAFEHDGDIRSLTADLHAGGNITIFRNFFGLPIGSFIPIRVNLGYRNLELMDVEKSHLNRTANIGSGSLGGGLGADIRIPTGLPVLEDNLTAFASLVASVGAMGDFTDANEGGFNHSPASAMKGVHLTRNTDFNFEAKFEHLLGGDLGVTAGLTLRWLHWTDNEAENFKQVLDIINGEEEDLRLRATQTFFRVGINW